MNAVGAARRAKGFTQQSLAEQMGVTQGAVSQWEKETTHPSAKLMPKLANILEITVDEIVRGSLNGQTPSD